MNTILIVIAAISSPFVLAFIVGAVIAMYRGSDKKRRANAIVTLSQMDKESRDTLIKIYQAYKINSVEETDKIVKNTSIDILNSLENLFSYQMRPADYDSGIMGIRLWRSFENKLKKLGYTEVVSKIITGVTMDNYNEILDKIANTKKQYVN